MGTKISPVRKTRIMQIIAWLLVLIWMGFIFFMSSQTATESDDISMSAAERILIRIYPDFENLTESEQQEIINTANRIVRKGGHMSEYFVLSALIIFALGFGQITPFKRAYTAVGLSSVYAITDEIHQLFVIGRSCQITDMLIDALGASIFAGLFLLVVYLKKKSVAKINNR